jgi:hypothetical protein
LIRNTPYGKRIQNKLQREQMDHFSGYQQNMAALGNQGVGLGHAAHGATRHIPQAHHQPPLNDPYNSQHGMYALQSGTALQGQGSFSQGHLNHQVHGLQPQSIDGYVLQGNSGHGQGLSTSQVHGTAGFSGISTFANMNTFNGTGLADPYHTSSFRYGM